VSASGETHVLREAHRGEGVRRPGTMQSEHSLRFASSWLFFCEGLDREVPALSESVQTMDEKFSFRVSGVVILHVTRSLSILYCFKSLQNFATDELRLRIFTRPSTAVLRYAIRFLTDRQLPLIIPAITGKSLGQFQSVITGIGDWHRARIFVS
jgi:hypothetical protein